MEDYIASEFKGINFWFSSSLKIFGKKFDIRSMYSHTFKRAERLKSRKIIGKMFQEGQSFANYPLRLIWTTIEPRLSAFPVQFTASVPKRAFPKAVHRNRIKRLIKEAWRLNKGLLYEKLDGFEQQFGFMLIYTAKEPLPFGQIEKAMQQIILRFSKKVRHLERDANH